ncbi:MAG: hypothetical protein LBB84_04950 [Tannerellaceae bacterium]|nr:hypothetical protein [Tannerellaceae bacterium]
MLTYKMLLSAWLLSGILSCNDQSTEHVVKLTTDWRNRTQGVAIPSHYTIKTRELHLDSISEESFLIPHAFQPGHHYIYVYNPAKNISIHGTTASVDVEDEYIKNLPGWFFTSAHHVVIEDNKHYDISAVMQQQIRELIFVLTVTSKDFANEIDHISASLNGVASQLDIPTGEVIGWPMSIKLDFTKNTDTTFTATTRMLGFIGETQILTCSITFNNHLPPIYKVFELHPLLEDFNADKITPMEVSVTIIQSYL